MDFSKRNQPQNPGTANNNPRFQDNSNSYEDSYAEYETFSGEEVLMSWEAPEYEHYPKEKNWYITAGLILSAIVIYAIFNNSPIMAITFILIGVVGYLYLQKEPSLIKFKITTEGIIAGKEIYEFDSIKSFWIFYDNNLRVVSLKTNSLLLPFVHIPIGNQDPSEIRKILLEFIRESKHKPNIVDAVERIFRV